MVKDTKLYDELEIKPDATEQEIKSAYKKLTKIWHPDKNPTRVEEATEKFRKISEAYTILTDAEKRSQYDKFGTIDENIPSNFDPRDIFSMFSGMHGMPDMPGMPGMPGMRRQRQEDCIIEQLVTLEELYNNKKIEIKYEQKSSCQTCNGYGSKDGLKHECPSCNGRGMSVRMIRQGPMVQQLMAPCNDCQGTGEGNKSSNLCDECNGHKFILKDKTFELQLNRNMVNNNRIIIENKGHQLKTGKTNLVILLKEQPHPVFKRNGKDLHIDLKLRLFQSLYGFNKLITHLDGRNILIKYDDMIKSMKTTMKIYNEGIGGDLYVNINTCMPKLDRLDENENNILKKLLIKAHLSEYTKEQNLIKNASKCITVNPVEVEEPTQQQEEFNEIPQGVQCAQQ